MTEQLALPLSSRPDDSVTVGDRVAHKDNPDFRGIVEDVIGDKALVRVLAWMGPILPPNPVTCRVSRLLVI